MDVTEEKRLLERLHQKDPAAMRWLYDRYAPMLMSVCRRYLPAKSDAEDALQEVFIRIINKIKTFRQQEGSSLQGWMTRIAVNMCISILRKGKRLNFVPLPEGVLLAEEPEPVYFHADHPFAYLIVEKTSETILFAGVFDGK